MIIMGNREINEISAKIDEILDMRSEIAGMHAQIVTLLDRTEELTKCACRSNLLEALPIVKTENGARLPKPVRKEKPTLIVSKPKKAQKGKPAQVKNAPKAMTSTRLLSTAELAEASGYKPKSIRTLAQKGIIPSTRVGRNHFFRPEIADKLRDRKDRK